MKKLFCILLTLLPMMASAQDNTWERINVEPEQKDNPDAKYLKEDAVPEIDGKICWTKSISAPGKTGKQIYDILLAQLEKMTGEPNQIKNSVVAVKDEEPLNLVPYSTSGWCSRMRHSHSTRHSSTTRSLSVVPTARPM